MMDEHLTWREHSSYLAKKLSKTSGVLYTLGKSIPKVLFKPIFNALINSHISYEITVWGGPRTVIDKVFTVQKKCLRSLFHIARKRKRNNKLFFGHTKNIFNNNGFLTVHNLYNYFILIEAFKGLAGCVPTSFQASCIKLYKLNHHRLLSKYCAISHFNDNFHVKLATIWNAFYSTNNIKTISPLKLKLFKRLAKKFILSMQSTMDQSDWNPINHDILHYCTHIKKQAYASSCTFDI